MWINALNSAAGGHFSRNVIFSKAKFLLFTLVDNLHQRMEENKGISPFSGAAFPNCGKIFFDKQIILCFTFGMKLNGIGWTFRIVDFQHLQQPGLFKTACGQNLWDIIGLAPTQPFVGNLVFGLCSDVVHKHIKLLIFPKKPDNDRCVLPGLKYLHALVVFPGFAIR